MSTGAATGVRKHAPAKVNLALHVTGKRADGYHTLDGPVAFAALGDTITAWPAAELSLTQGGPFAGDVAADESNLVLRAARLLAERHGVAAGAHLHLDKQLPVAAGLGGGSADAAAALAALAELWGLDAGNLDGLAGELGADVPMCLHAEPAFVGGIGESLTPIPGMAPVPAVLINPGEAVSTPAAFQARGGAFSATVARWRRPPGSVRELAGRLSSTRNDLMPAAASIAPAIHTVLDALTEAPGCLLARMSGSGATCVGLFANTAAARTTAHTLAAAHPAWWVRSTHLGG